MEACRFYWYYSTINTVIIINECRWRLASSWVTQVIRVSSEGKDMLRDSVQMGMVSPHLGTRMLAPVCLPGHVCVHLSPHLKRGDLKIWVTKDCLNYLKWSHGFSLLGNLTVTLKKKKKKKQLVLQGGMAIKGDFFSHLRPCGSCSHASSCRFESSGSDTVAVHLMLHVLQQMYHQKHRDPDLHQT